MISIRVRTALAALLFVSLPLGMIWAGQASSQQAWQPLTPPGVAAFAVASLGRLMLVQLNLRAGKKAKESAAFTSAW